MGNVGSQEVLLTVESLNKKFLTTHGVIEAIKNVNFQIYRSELACIIGPSGCGKSTILSMIGGISKPTSGKILLEGKQLTGPSPDIGIVFQKYAAFPWMTVEQNVEYGPRMRGLNKSERRAIMEKYVELVNLKGYEHLYPKELSGGMSKRVDIARAYANNPRILLMDEPFGALDDLTKKKMQEELLKIWSLENKTIFFVTHDLEEAAFLADRIIIMRRNPNTIIKDVKVKFSRPRQAELRTEQEFVEFKKYLSEVMGSDTGANS
jgi:ABC-type nitrate/sulfonate/bicarbonate transport system ATPase subunit